MKSEQGGKFRFVISNQDSQATAAVVRKRLNEATAAALKEARAAGAVTQAYTQLEGGIFGIGETAVILFIAHAAKAGGVAAALGAAGAAGKEFYTAYLSPQLRRLNLLPKKLKELPADEETKKTPAKKSPAKKAAKKKATKKSSK